ncbi:DNA polymerase ligase N-terminal domain-containing protein [Nocardioides dilutus]
MPDPLRFVVNHHRATTLHFDFRLEVRAASPRACERTPTGEEVEEADADLSSRRAASDVSKPSTLVSWAVPKGPSLDPGQRRLAVQVEDHGMEHLDYEDEHKVVWDTGLYQPAKDPLTALERGHLRFVVLGEKIRGAFALTRTRMGGDDRNWILVKIDDEYADSDDPLDDHRSVISGLTLDDLAGG